MQKKYLLFYTISKKNWEMFKFKVWIFNFLMKYFSVSKKIFNLLLCTSINSSEYFSNYKNAHQKTSQFSKNRTGSPHRSLHGTTSSSYGLHVPRELRELRDRVQSALLLFLLELWRVPLIFQSAHPGNCRAIGRRRSENRKFPQLLWKIKGKPYSQQPQLFQQSPTTPGWPTLYPLSEIC